MRNIRDYLFLLFGVIAIGLLGANLVVMRDILRRMPPTLAEIRAAEGEQARALRLQAPVVHATVLGSVEVYGQVDTY